MSPNTAPGSATRAMKTSSSATSTTPSEEEQELARGGGLGQDHLARLEAAGREAADLAETSCGLIIAMGTTSLEPRSREALERGLAAAPIMPQAAAAAAPRTRPGAPLAPEAALAPLPAVTI